MKKLEAKHLQKLRKRNERRKAKRLLAEEQKAASTPRIAQVTTEAGAKAKTKQKSRTFLGKGVEQEDLIQTTLLKRKKTMRKKVPLRIFYRQAVQAKAKAERKGADKKKANKKDKTDDLD